MTPVLWEQGSNFHHHSIITVSECIKYKFLSQLFSAQFITGAYHDHWPLYSKSISDESLCISCLIHVQRAKRVVVWPPFSPGFILTWYFAKMDRNRKLTNTYESVAKKQIILKVKSELNEKWVLEGNSWLGQCWHCLRSED